MLLSPQHFQQESARVDQLVAWQCLAADPMAWGVRRLEIDDQRLRMGLLRVLQLEAVMPDGTAVSYSVDRAPGYDLELELKPFAEQLETKELPVFLTLGRARSVREKGQPSRFRELRAEPVHDEVSEALPVEIPRVTANLALTMGDVPSSVYLHIRLMTLRRDNEVYKRGSYLPAMLSVPRDSDVHMRAVRLVTQMRSKAAFLAKQTASPSSRLEDRIAMLEQKARLASLVMALPVLEGALGASECTPYRLFMALCAQLGPLSLLRPGAVPLQPPEWDTADPLSALDPVLRSVEDLVGEVSQDWRTHVFGFDGRMFSLELQPQWLGKRLVVGLRGQTERDHVAWMAGAVIGSRTVWTTLSDRRILGAPRKQVEEAPDLGVRASSGYTLFSIDVSESFIVADQPLVISNTNETSTSQRPQEVVLFTKG
ncbi:type VI secretion system baseplate subunit TssK [Ramlibacter sp. GTP1]|uniref:Type VI secretion system baseplate subunit TssK n=2 Tax=Ramlibacter albus TaxID=2079448 RepID=A0A923M637_9BURK|nr:type VI secretion system baseplate subunit TssK [Ramlibacter albus]